ncbi:type II secretion system protein [Verrucomicrobiales bacterium BCK34]|nr:type II secretion system protein [Verrucomicrobiales bacterium BCK34]
MKISQNRIYSRRGFTLIEITLVIAVLLGLISVLFVGAASYKEGTNRAKCIMTIATVQKAVRSYQNLNELEPGDTLNFHSLVGEERLIEYITPCGSQAPLPPELGAADSFAASGYIGMGMVPESGIPYLSCMVADLGHVPDTSSSW